jgi:ATP-dependent RNA helicase DDX3X
MNSGNAPVDTSTKVSTQSSYVPPHLRPQSQATLPSTIGNTNNNNNKFQGQQRNSGRNNNTNPREPRQFNDRSNPKPSAASGATDVPQTSHQRQQREPREQREQREQREPREQREQREPRQARENYRKQDKPAETAAVVGDVPVVTQQVPTTPTTTVDAVAATVTEAPPQAANTNKFLSSSARVAAVDSSAAPSGTTAGLRYNNNNNNNNNRYPTRKRHTAGVTRGPEYEAQLFGEARTGIDFATYDGIPANATGENVPKPIAKFSEIQFGAHVESNLKLCGYERPTPIQKYSLPIAMADRDMIACAQTGSGKTAAFLLPIVYRLLNSDILPPPPSSSSFRSAQAPQALILGPTRELVTQIYKEATKLTYATTIRPVVVYGGHPIHEQINDLSRGCHLIVATPGRLRDLCERGRVSLQNIQMLILDEADCMLDMGFFPQIEELLTKYDMPTTGRQTLMFSATFPAEIQRIAGTYLKKYIYVTIGRVGSSTSLVTQNLISSPAHEDAKRETLLELLNKCDGLTLIFVETRRSADLLEQFLVDHDINAASIHGDRSQTEREQALSFFKTGHCPVLVATDVAARGISIPNVEYVINYDMPSVIDDYVHRIGRTGRCGARGTATSFISDKNKGIASDLLDNMREAKQIVPEFLQALVDSRGGYGGGYGYNKGGYGSYSKGGYGGRGGNSGGSRPNANVDVRYSGGNNNNNTNNNNNSNTYSSNYSSNTTSGSYYGSSKQSSNSNPTENISHYGSSTKKQPLNTSKSFSPTSTQPTYGSSSSALSSVQVSDDAW